MQKIIGIYLKIPILFDLIIGGILFWIAGSFSVNNSLDIVNRQAFQDLTNELISSSISVGGFVVASLTIIITFRQMVTYKSMEESSNAQELLFNSKIYPQILRIYSYAAFVLLFCFVLFCCIRILEPQISDPWLLLLILMGGALTVMSTFRCLWILHKIIIIQVKHQKKMEKRTKS